MDAGDQGMDSRVVGLQTGALQHGPYGAGVVGAQGPIVLVEGSEQPVVEDVHRVDEGSDVSLRQRTAPHHVAFDAAVMAAEDGRPVERRPLLAEEAVEIRSDAADLRGAARKQAEGFEHTSGGLLDGRAMDSNGDPALGKMNGGGDGDVADRIGEL